LNNARIREKAEVAIFVTLEKATKPMENEATAAGFYEPPYSKKVPRFQIFTIADLLGGKRPQLPAVSVLDTYEEPPMRIRARSPSRVIFSSDKHKFAVLPHAPNRTGVSSFECSQS